MVGVWSVGISAMCEIPLTLCSQHIRALRKHLASPQIGSYNTVGAINPSRPGIWTAVTSEKKRIITHYSYGKTISRPFGPITLIACTVKGTDGREA